MSKKYSELGIKNKLVIQANRKLKYLMGPLTSYYGLNNISLIMDYANYYKKLPIKKERILYQSRDGKSMTDSPYAIFKYLLHKPEYKNFTHVWVCETNELRLYYKRKYKKYNNVEFVVIHGKEYLKELAQSKYLINNSSFSIYFTSRPEQVYINTWHGTPLKHLGLDLENSLIAIQNLFRNFLHTKYILSQNSHSSDIFNRAFQLNGLYEGEIIESGYPRTDLTFNTDKEKLIKNIQNENLVLTREKNLLFAPTYRGDFMNPEDDLDELFENITKLYQNTSYNILLKVHPFIYESILEDGRFSNYLIDDKQDPNELLSITDLLVTDYSSIFFDFLVTEKPIIFFTSDYDKYKLERGLYIDVDSLPGPTTQTIDELLGAISTRSYLDSEYLSKYQSFREKYVSHDDGNVTERLVNKIFNEPSITLTKHNKERILIYAGGMMNNGITSSLMNLLQNIDYSRYEVVIFLQRNFNKIALDNLSNINKNVKIVLRNGGFFASLTEHYRNEYVRKRGLISAKEERLYPNKAYRREFRRLFGNSTFDYVIDFSGYSMFWSNILLATHSKKKFIYLHSDMKQDLVKEVNNRKPHIINLKGLMTLYPRFDKLINVSNEVHQINKRKLRNLKIEDEKFVTVQNLLDLNKMYNDINNSKNILKLDEDKDLIIANSPSGIDMIEFNKNNFNIFASGRLSPEKGFDKLIRAFSRITLDYPNARLFILGEGKDRSILETLIHRYSLSDKVFLLGHQSNPFALIYKADLFVLSSEYEGQGLVVLESLALRRNVLATDLEVTRELLDNGKYGMLKENTEEALADGMRTFLENKAPIYPKYDVNRYNKEALAQFNSLFE